MAVLNTVNQLSTYCRAKDFCVNPWMSTANCGDGMKAVGFIASGRCSPEAGHPICCPNSSGIEMVDCKWRSGDDGKSGICNGKCLDYEVSWGDGDIYGDDVFSMCTSGKKQFCCKAPQVKQALTDCRWTGWWVYPAVISRFFIQAQD